MTPNENWSLIDEQNRNGPGVVGHKWVYCHISGIVTMGIEMCLMMMSQVVDDTKAVFDRVGNWFEDNNAYVITEAEAKSEGIEWFDWEAASGNMRIVDIMGWIKERGYAILRTSDDMHYYVPDANKAVQLFLDMQDGNPFAHEHATHVVSLIFMIMDGERHATDAMGGV